MSSLKIQLHCHTKSDPVDLILHSDKELIDRAAKEHFDVLAITCHNKLVFSKSLEEFAKEKGIILVPGIEKDISKKHILIINAKPEAESVETFEQLRKYRLSHPESIIIAAHPYYPMPYAIGDKLLNKNLDCFDFIEWNGFYSKKVNFNKKAERKAPIYNKTIIGNADCHDLNYLSKTCTHLKSEKNLESIISALKNDPEIEIETSPYKGLQLSKQIAYLTIGELYKKHFMKD